ncbi:MAG: histidine phosphotransferase family protein [Paracoccaceae bacterium]
MTKPNLESQAIARICHDLISPIGAISNGVELLSDVNGRSPELDLIAQSARAARDKISFFRLAFDGASPGVTMAGSAVAQTAVAMFQSARMRANPMHLPQFMPRDEARLLLLLMLCVESALPLGGQLDMAGTSPDFTLVGNGRRITIEPDYWEHLQDGCPVGAPTATRVHFLLAHLALADCGLRLKYTTGETHISLQLSAA